jgi:hypothetical protein
MNSFVRRIRVASVHGTSRVQFIFILRRMLICLCRKNTGEFVKNVSELQEYFLDLMPCLCDMQGLTATGCCSKAISW